MGKEDGRERTIDENQSEMTINISKTSKEIQNNDFQLNIEQIRVQIY